MKAAAQALYREREQRVTDAVMLRKPDRTPVVVLFGAFASRYAGISRTDELYDLEKSYRANLDALIEFGPEMASAPLTFGSVLETLDYRQMRWSGYGLPDDYGYQYVEGEYMKREEYDAFIFDPSDYVIRYHWPRTLGKMSVFGELPPIRTMISYFFGLTSGFIPFASAEGIEALDALRKAAEESAKSMKALRQFVCQAADAGFPMFFSSGTQAPFDTLGDYFRGTKGILLDMYREPRKLEAACEKLLPVMIETAVPAAKASGNPRVLIPLHKGSDNFMSLEQFRRFYWPTLKELLLALLREGLTPILFIEGPYTSRLETISDVPEGKMIYWFENADMARAKEVLGGKVCIMGNVPMSLLSTGTTTQVKEYCTKLLNLFARDGGYIMSAGAVLDEAKAENVRAMIDTARQYR